MTTHKVVSREEWAVARKELLAQEKEVITSGKAGGLAIVNRSKRLLLLFSEPPKVASTVKPGATQGGYFLNSFNCSNRLSSASCS